MQVERMPELNLNTNQRENETEGVPKRDEKRSSWRKAEEHGLNEPN
jgi:hypothetical protein